MTERLYYHDASLLTFDAVVTRIEHDADQVRVYLDRSAFYPTSGGQSHDLGTLNDQPVIEVMETENGEVAHILSGTGIQSGTAVHGIIDGKRRLKNRQQHSAQHIISHICAQRYNTETLSVHLGEEYGAVELDRSQLDESAIDLIEREANEFVSADLSIAVIFATSEEAGQMPLRKQPSREGPIRIIRIGNLDWSACGGTHCDSAAQVRLIKLIGTEKMRGHLLVKFLTGQQAVDDYRMRFDVTDRLAKLLTCHPRDIEGRLESLTAENKELRKGIAQCRKELLPVRAVALAERAVLNGKVPLVVECIDDVEPASLSQLATLVAESVKGITVLMHADRIAVSVIDDSPLKADQIVRALCVTFMLKGGGNARTAQCGGADSSKLEEYRNHLITLVHDA